MNQEQLTNIFQAVDKNRSGTINSEELQKCLSNGTWTPFNQQTVQLMMNMFDRDRSGQISFDEFQQLWKYITDWQVTFRSYDRDNSGFIDSNELKLALTNFGYRFQDNIYYMIIKKFDRQQRGQVAFDDFIQCSVALQTMTNLFRSYDTSGNGTVTMNYEQFVMMVLTSGV